MGSPLLTVHGMFHGPHSLTAGRLREYAVADGADRVALRLVDVTSGELFLHLHTSEVPTGDDARWVVRLWSPAEGPSSPLRSIDAMSFASFVGRS